MAAIGGLNRKIDAYQPRSFDHERGPVTPMEDEDTRASGFLPTGGPGSSRAGRSTGGFQTGARDTSQTDFASLKFERENTLLTNAEEYAASIREEAELYVKQLRADVDALNDQAQARYAEAREAKDQGEAEARDRIAQAQAGADAVREQAYQEGLEAGSREGMAKRYEEAGTNLEALERMLVEIGQYRDHVRFNVEKDSIRLAVLLAKKVLRQELTVNKKVILQLLAKTLTELEDKGTFRVWLSPADHQFAVAARKGLEKFMGEDQQLSLRAKADLAPGNILIESDREVIDLSFQSQFHHLDSLLAQTLNERETIVTRRGGVSGGARAEEPETSDAG
jgi:flagellar assembly protein FliH